MSFDRLIRFIDEESIIRYGDIAEPLSPRQILGSEVETLHGSLETGFLKTGEIHIVKKLLNPLERCPIVLCVGLNYHEHVKETNAFVPSKPVVFMTPSERLCGPTDDIVAHDEAQPMLDYEGELAFIFAQDAKDIPEQQALDYILGYTVSNDVSARNLVSMEVAFNQMGHSKSFDTFGPIGPCIVAQRLVQDPHQLHLVTRVNGEVRQDTHTSDMIWQIKQLVAWLSKNRTIRKGTVVMTGTSNGVGWHSGGLLKDGDIVEVEISEIGSITNRVVFK